MNIFEQGKKRRHGGGLNSAQAKLAARKRWDATPRRMCEVCGKEHRCWPVEVEEEGEVQGAIEQLVELFVKSLKPTVVVKKGDEQ